MNRFLPSLIMVGIAGLLILIALASTGFVLWAARFPHVVLAQTPTHFLHITSRAPQPGSTVEYCPKCPAPHRLANGDMVLAYRCTSIGWLPFHLETAWAACPVEPAAGR